MKKKRIFGLAGIAAVVLAAGAGIIIRLVTTVQKEIAT